jgi:L-lysine 6-transaminase
MAKMQRNRINLMVHEILKKYTIGDGLSIVIDLDKSKGSWIVDKITGNRYLDCYSQFASQPIGWNHPKLLENIETLGKIALHKIANSDMYSEILAEFTETFAKITPDFDYHFFIEGGTLGVENALKASFDYKMKKTGWKEEKDEWHDGSNEDDTWRLDVLHMEHAFHGRSGYTLSLTNTSQTKTWGFPKFKWSRLYNPINGANVSTNGREDYSLELAKKIMESGNVAAFIIEPIQGEGGDKHFTPRYIQGLRKLTEQYDVMFIVDEVQTGVGLSGKMWAYEHYGIKPDMLCFGKKVQLGGFCSTKKIDEVPRNVFKVSSRINSTWGGNIVDMMRFCIIANIIKEEKLVENAAIVGEYFLERLKELPLLNIRGKGLMIAFDLPSPEERDLFYNKLMEKILCLKCGYKSIRFRPHLTFSKEDADEAIKIINSIME